jgi:hypothetical protein
VPALRRHRQGEAAVTRGLTLGGKMRAAWTRLGTVESDSEPGVEHVIEQVGTTEAFRCDCMAYRFARGKVGSVEKRCKHILALLGAQPVVPSHQLVTGQRTKVRGEQFTVRRAFNFGP